MRLRHEAVKHIPVIPHPQVSPLAKPLNEFMSNLKGPEIEHESEVED